MVDLLSAADGTGPVLVETDRGLVDARDDIGGHLIGQVLKHHPADIGAMTQTAVLGIDLQQRRLFPQFPEDVTLIALRGELEAARLGQNVPDHIGRYPAYHQPWNSHRADIFGMEVAEDPPVQQGLDLLGPQPGQELAAGLQQRSHAVDGQQTGGELEAHGIAADHVDHLVQDVVGQHGKLGLARRPPEEFSRGRLVRYAEVDGTGRRAIWASSPGSSSSSGPGLPDSRGNASERNSGGRARPDKMSRRFGRAASLSRNRVSDQTTL